MSPGDHKCNGKSALIYLGGGRTLPRGRGGQGAGHSRVAVNPGLRVTRPHPPTPQATPWLGAGARSPRGAGLHGSLRKAGNKSPWPRVQVRENRNCVSTLNLSLGLSFSPSIYSVSGFPRKWVHGVCPVQAQQAVVALPGVKLQAMHPLSPWPAVSWCCFSAVAGDLVFDPWPHPRPSESLGHLAHLLLAWLACSSARNLWIFGFSAQHSGKGGGVVRDWGGVGGVGDCGGWGRVPPCRGYFSSHAEK